MGEIHYTLLVFYIRTNRLDFKNILQNYSNYSVC